MTGYIDAEKMQSHLEEEIEGCGNPTADNNPIAYGTTLGLKMALSYTKTLSTADVAPVVHAHWERCIDTEDGRYYKCTVCGRTIFIDKDFVWRDPKEDHPYCHCGAKMDERIGEDGEIH